MFSPLGTAPFTSPLEGEILLIWPRSLGVAWESQREPAP
jgi:hypothetical protein